MSRPSIDPGSFDTTIRPTDDFFDFVNGRWLAENPIPAEESRWGSFYVLRAEVEKQIGVILDDLIKDKMLYDRSVARKVRDFYVTAMDVEKCNRLGIAPLAGLFAKIDAAQEVAELTRVIGELQRDGISTWWAPIVAQDEKNAELMAYHPYQGGLGLPDRDYYLNEDEKSRAIRGEYLTYMKKILTLVGMDPELSSAIMKTEMDLAKVSLTRVELRDPEKLYNKQSFAEVVQLTPSIDWMGYFRTLGISSPGYFIVGQPKFMGEVSRIFETTPLTILKTCLRWHVVNSMAPFLTEEIERLRFDFYGRTFGGMTVMKPRWRRVVGIMSEVLEDAVAQLYVERHFSAEAKHKVNELVDYLIAAYRARIERLDWMGIGTKEKALRKLSAVARKLGYPDRWKDLSALSVGTASYAENYIMAHAFEFDRQMKKIGGPVDRTEWYMSPQTVNACYEPTLNEILFPAAILQPPFFNPQADDAMNFGGIGSVIGHELTHGFDDQGGRFDDRGNLHEWWIPEDKKRFDEEAARLVKQFDEYEPLPELHINGKLTLGENIADLGGLHIAYDGLMLALQEDAEKNRSINGLTPVQRFFISYATIERAHVREESLRLQVQTNPHSPPKYRVNGLLPNMPEFYQAFGCKPGDKLFRKPEDRVQIW
jgi:putative endopeptidase